MKICLLFILVLTFSFSIFAQPEGEDHFYTPEPIGIFLHKTERIFGKEKLRR